MDIGLCIHTRQVHTIHGPNKMPISESQIANILLRAFGPHPNERIQQRKFPAALDNDVVKRSVEYHQLGNQKKYKKNSEEAKHCDMQA